MRARTLLSLADEARVLSDTVDDDHITSFTVDGVQCVTHWINQGIAELWRKIVAADPDRYIVNTPLATTAGTSAYDLEEDFFQIRRVDRMDGTRRIPIEPFSLQQAPYDNADPRSNGTRARYRVMGQGIDGGTTQIFFDPDPGTATYSIWYVQAPQVLAADDDVFDGVAGFEDFVVAFAATRILIRQERDPSGPMAEMQRVQASIITAAAHRDVGRAPRIADVRRGARMGWR